jgi:hypothetical protein
MVLRQSGRLIVLAQVFSHWASLFNSMNAHHMKPEDVGPIEHFGRGGVLRVQGEWTAVPPDPRRTTPLPFLMTAVSKTCEGITKLHQIIVSTALLSVRHDGSIHLGQDRLGMQDLGASLDHLDGKQGFGIPVHVAWFGISKRKCQGKSCEVTDEWFRMRHSNNREQRPDAIS